VDDSGTINQLLKAIGRANRSAKFCVAGCLPPVDPGIEVQGYGAAKLPLKPTAAKKLVAHGRPAPYGKGTRTLVNRSIRNTCELDPKKFRLSKAWNAAIADAMRPVAEELGLPAEQLDARLYKLLVYERDGFFVKHRDSEKHDRMVASLVVVLPNQFEGGSLVVRHGAEKRILPFDEAAAGKAPCYAAFYADCEHEVQRVTGGVRLCLAYNLVLNPKRKTGREGAAGKAAGKQTAPAEVLAESIGSWVARQPAKPMVFALEHHYTQRGLSRDLLKGADRRLADLVVAAAEKSECIVHLAQVTRHLLQDANDGAILRSARPTRMICAGRSGPISPAKSSRGGTLGSSRRPSSPRCRSTTGSRLPRSTRATRAMPATRSTAGITGRRSSSGIATTTSTSSPAREQIRAFRFSVR
jgi:hypothetical protein